MYGAMTWPVFSEKARQVFNCWSTCVKLAWDVPRAIHTYPVDNLLAGGLPSIRSSVLARFCKFFGSLRSSSCLALRVMANISANDIRSVTGNNLSNIKKEILLDPTRDLMSKVKVTILGIRAAVPMQDRWKVSCLRKFLEKKYILDTQHQDTDDVEQLIESLCIS